MWWVLTKKRYRYLYYARICSKTPTIAGRDDYKRVNVRQQNLTGKIESYGEHQKNRV